MKNRACVIVTPVRNEEEFLPATIESVVHQTVTPLRWIIVDDGSTDGTGRIASEAARRHPWIQAVRRQDRGFRKNGSGVMEAFYDGYRRVESEDWDVLVKLDGDLKFEKDTFSRIVETFGEEPRLGITGGDVFHEQDGEIVIESRNDPAFHVRGATKFYRRACWESISGLHPVTGWDTLDEVKANMLGWTTRRIAEVRFLHLRPTGGAEGGWRNAFKNGRGGYIAGYHPLYMLAKCIKRLPHRPVLIQSFGLFAGFFSSYLSNVERVSDPQLVRYLRSQQVRRLFGRSSTWA